MKQISVDFSKITGKIKPMHSVNNGPAGSRVRGTSSFDEYAAAGIPFARNHDASFYSGYGGEHTVDVHRIFKRFEADENDPASYSFESTDKYTKDILEAGTKVFYRLGASIEHEQKFGTIPPADFEKWARICEHIIRHYNEGWADGFHYNIEYWEIWNEPDCRNPDGSNPCWQGTDEQFDELFITSVRHLKKCFPHLKIGGPALTSTWKDDYNKRFFDAISAVNLPLDFFSFHGYARLPEKYAESAYHARELLDSYGYTDAEIILNEWNYIKGWVGEQWKYSLRMEKSLKGASFTVASMICAQNSPMDHFMYYDARPCGMCGLFDTDTMDLLKGYYPFPMFNALYKLGPQAESSSDEGLYSLASIQGEEASILLTHYYDEDELPAETVKLSMKGLPEGVWTASFYLLDTEHDNELVREETFTTGGMDAYVKLPLFSTYLVRLQRACDYKYILLDNGSVEITGYQGNESCIVIPSVLKGSPVVSIGDRAFGCRDSLISVSIPDSVTSIGAWAFARCKNLNSISFPNALTCIKDGTFFGCRSLTDISIPDSVTSIGAEAFCECYFLTGLTLPDSLASIGSDAFYKCSQLTSLFLPNSVTFIGTRAFGSCPSLAEISVSPDHPAFISINGVLFNKEITQLVCFPCGFPGNEYFIPDGTLSIGCGAFSGCERLTEVTLPHRVPEVSAVKISAPCGQLYVILPDSLTSVESMAFEDCFHLMYVIFPSSLTSIGDDVFTNCDLHGVTIPASVTYIGDDAFDYTAPEDVDFPYPGWDEPTLILIVERGSYAEQYAKMIKVEYAYAASDSSCQ